MSYHDVQGYGRSSEPSANQLNSPFGSDQAFTWTTRDSVPLPYQVPNSQQHYTVPGHAWSGQNQLGPGEGNTSVQNFSDPTPLYPQAQRPTYHSLRPQTENASAPNRSSSNGDWYVANNPRQTQPSTQALSNLAYASTLDAQGLDAQGQKAKGGRMATKLNHQSTRYDSARPGGHDQDKGKPPMNDLEHTASNTGSPQTRQSGQSPGASHQNLAVSAAAALVGAVNRGYNRSPHQESLPIQQYQSRPLSVSQPANQTSSSTPISHYHQGPTSAQDNTGSQIEERAPTSPITRTQPGNSKYSSNGTHRYPESTSPDTSLPLLATTASSKSPLPYGSIHQRGSSKAGAGQSHDRSDTSNAVRIAPTMPSVIDLGQVFNPYHKEYEHHQREEARAKRASTEASEVGGITKGQQDLSQPAETVIETAKAGMELQGHKQTAKDATTNEMPQSSPATGEPKISGEVDMANEMKAIMQRMRELKSKDPSFFKKLWNDMRQGGQNAHSLKGPTPSQSPQPTETTPLMSQAPEPLQLETSEAPQAHLQDRATPSQTANTAASRAKKRHLAVTMVVENNQEASPDLGRIPSDRRNRVANREIADGKARQQELQQPIPTPSPQPSQMMPETTKTVERLALSTTKPPQPPALANASASEAPRQPYVSSNPSAGAPWPQAKRTALAEATQKALMDLTANKSRTITAAEIHTILEQNPSYAELCEKLERKGFALHRGQLARYLLYLVPDLITPSFPQSKTAQQPSHSGSAASSHQAQPLAPLSAPTSSVALPTPPISATPKEHLPPLESTYINHGHFSGPPTKVTPVRPVKPRIGVPSPNIPAPTPGSKEAKARKRNFSELVDMTQLSSDDEDYVMPTKQARHGEILEGQMFPTQSEKLTSSTLSRSVPPADIHHQSFDPDRQNFGPPAATAPLKSNPQALPSMFQSHANGIPQASLTLLPRSRHLLAKPLNKAEALRKSYYDPKTVARDILIAAGRHPGEHPLNAHLAGLLGKHIDIDSDLSTFDWDRVDPGGPPRPVVPIVDIPAGPPRWTPGSKIRFRGSTVGTSEAAPRARVVDKVKPNQSGGTSQSGRSLDKKGAKAMSREEPDKDDIVEVQSSLARLSSQTTSLLQDSIKPRNPPKQATHLRQTENVDDESRESNAPPEVMATEEKDAITPLHTTFLTPLTSPSPTSSQPSPKRGPRRRSTSVIMEQLPAETEKRRRGRPPGSKGKEPALSMRRMPAKTSGIEVAIPPRRRSTSPAQYKIYACQWSGCDAELHNLSTLRKHIARVHKASGDEIEGAGQACWWKGCRTLEIQDDKMVPRVKFNSIPDWLDHIDSDHLYPLGLQLGDGPSSAQIDAQTIARDRQSYLSDKQGRAVTAASTSASIKDYPADTLMLSSVTMNPESNIPNRAFSKAHGNEKMELKQSAVETLLALQQHKAKVGPGLDRGGCTLVNAERRSTLIHDAGLARVVDGDY